ncbi:hypothetical protein ACCM60_14095 [Pseudomonas chlororaphis subsp. aureofaciens]|uniref:hypothetical protein n=1 Tax=Pseudomonas chlororaphis TaxID=587753 RepID=UPI003558D7B7
MDMHTPGPWAVVDGYYPGFIKIAGPAFDISIVTSAADLDFKDFCARTADAKLIAAAPEMLKALQGIVSACDATFEVVALNLDDARAAIAKATS